MNISSCFQRFISAAMFHPCRKLMKLAKKPFSRGHDHAALGSLECSKSIADKGHFVVYTVDGRRFMVPLEYLHCPIFQQLFKMSEDAFGLPSDGPIKLPCDTVFMECIVSFLQKRVSIDRKMLKKAGVFRSFTSLPNAAKSANAAPCLLRICSRIQTC
ncbi:hypothetical protein ACLOJK_002321 [Asimina triloba]